MKDQKNNRERSVFEPFFQLLLVLAITAAASLYLAGCAGALPETDSLGAGVNSASIAADDGSPQGMQTGNALPEVVGRVNGEPLSRDELERLLVNPEALERFHRELGGEPENKELTRLAFRKLVRRHLFLQEGTRRHLIITDQDLDRAIVALRRNFPDLQNFGLWMQEQGLDDTSLFQAVRTDLLIKRVMAALVEEVEVSDQQVREYYQAHGDELQTPGDVQLRLIAVDSEAAALEIMTALEQGENFSRLARSRSQGKLAAKGGDTGWVDPLTLPGSLREAVAGLEEGEAYGPLRKGPEEFLIVGLAGRRPERTRSLEEARPEIERRLLGEKQTETLEAWLAAQESRAAIEIFL